MRTVRGLESGIRQSGQGKIVWIDGRNEAGGKDGGKNKEDIRGDKGDDKDHGGLLRGQDEGGIRQECGMSPLQFNLYMSKADSWFRERNIGGIALSKENVWLLTYADDMVLVAKNREAMLDMMVTLRRFFKQRRMILYEKKTKMMVFNRGKSEKKESWKWGKENIEEVQKFKYLGFTFNKDENYKDHVKELGRTGRMAANKV